MSWAYPQHKFSTSLILDCDEFNDNMVAYATEVNGGLNEHNLSEGCLYAAMSQGVVEYDVAARLYNRKEPISPVAAVGTMAAIPVVSRWTPVDGTARTFNSRGGLVLVMIGFQLRVAGPSNNATGLNFCIGLDGIPQLDTLLGTGDQSNDLVDLAKGATVGGGEVEYDYGTSPSFRAAHERHLVKGLLRVEPGPHAIRLFARNLVTPNNTGTSTPQYISQREVIVLDMWA